MKIKTKQLYRFLVASFIFLIGIGCSSNDERVNFTLWQLPSQINTIGNSYIFQMTNGEVVVLDGGVKEEEFYLRGFLAALGNHVSLWFVSHPHPDHIGALNEILKRPDQLKIDKICHSAFSPEFCELEPEYKDAAIDFYSNLKKTTIPVVDLKIPGDIFRIDKTMFKILGVTDESITSNPFNNSSMIIKVWDKEKSILFLSDAGIEAGNKLLNGPYRKELDCDYLQMAHHGQKGVSKDFYRNITFKACLWPTPTWVYNNDIGNGYNTHEFETVEIRNLIDSIGIKHNFVSCEGLYKIEYAVD
ncbi:MAG: MBL fold metallo-hydrolase [Massilibacteroides sp.]|nr:MBL fold metallo-hydrolase [Massilibacteroides sp.]MDD3061707.1 MBL fold metallo-hydrolase [Massilibacteroides sp.]MDD4114330.1 MBL fold metallo-hydrolase [Massilibacteroides sp.]MDD4660248.1 MBL fold metallo-hydrolase [Massilibacteroides sp.]